MEVSLVYLLHLRDAMIRGSQIVYLIVEKSSLTSGLESNSINSINSTEWETVFGLSVYLLHIVKSIS